jgi:hypothetical protein
LTNQGAQLVYAIAWPRQFQAFPLYWNHQPVPPPWQSLDQTGLISGVAQRYPEFHDGGVDAAVEFHDCVIGPEALADFLARNYAAIRK